VDASNRPDSPDTNLDTDMVSGRPSSFRPVKILRSMVNKIVTQIITALERPLSWAVRLILRRPALASNILRHISRFPHMTNHLRQIHHRTEMALMLNKASVPSHTRRYEMNRASREVCLKLQASATADREKK